MQCTERDRLTRRPLSCRRSPLTSEAGGVDGGRRSDRVAGATLAVLALVGVTISISSMLGGWAGNVACADAPSLDSAEVVQC